MGRKPIFSKEDESELSQRILAMAEMYYGITPSKLRSVVFEFAEKKEIKHTFNKSLQLAGKSWIRLFLRRHPNISLRQPEGTSLNRIEAFNKKEIDQFFFNLQYVYAKFNFSPHRLYNVDETGITTIQSKCSRVYAEKGKKRVGAMTSGERGRKVTAIFCMSALGHFIPPMMIYPRIRMDPKLKHNGPEEGLYKCSKNGWSNNELFCEWLKHFIRYVKPTAYDPVLLIMDSHSSHVSLAAYEICKTNNIIVVTLPPHTSHLTQPLDVAFFGPFKKALREEKEMYLSSHPFERITEHFLAEFLNKAFQAVGCIEKGISGFKATGIWPLNLRIFDRELTVANRINKAADEVNMSLELKVDIETITDESFGEATVNAQPSQTVKVEIPIDQTNDKNSSSILQSILSTPKKCNNSTGVKRKSRPKMQSEIFTLTPKKEKLEHALKKRMKQEERSEENKIKKKWTKKKVQMKKDEFPPKRGRGRPKKVRKVIQEDEEAQEK
ncbi:uncharacterized protein LOC131431741 [Malaya genurostris]|uniref:uncharacterized protein LOC131431741 n=1 Tax=Malaya genurostris TaxID=325434 RepID=UPI0026F3B1EF|nr:uncharacterized protein LOC131431741 [Malaya genurostris]